MVSIVLCKQSCAIIERKFRVYVVMSIISLFILAPTSSEPGMHYLIFQYPTLLKFFQMFNF